MFVKQLYTNCLAEAAYYIESEGEAAIIDPLRESEPYLALAAERGTSIKYVFETHFHADFVSGHLDLSAKTGAAIVFGPNAQPNYKAYVAQDGEELRVGKLTIKVLHTPGHTMESTTYLLRDEQGRDYAIFTGDTLFIGDVGRPDLAVKTHLTMEDLAGHLYDSLHTKILPLADEVIVYPGHGAGSACGKNLSKETFATLGNQRQFNYALQPLSKAEFIRQVTDGLSTPPQYFPENVRMNKGGYDSFDSVLERGTTPLSAAAFAKHQLEGVLVLDVRPAQTFKDGFVPGSLNIGLNGDFAPWVGALVSNVNRPILLVCDAEKANEAVTRLSRVGYDHVLGFLDGGIEAWRAAGFEVQTLRSVSAESFVSEFSGSGFVPTDSNVQIIDVRKPGEYTSSHLKAVSNYSLQELPAQLAALDKSKTYFIHCAGGYRSMIAASILRANGFGQVIDVAGGYNAIQKEGLSPEWIATTACSSTLAK